MNPWVVSTFWLPWIVLLWFLVWEYLFKYTFLIIWGIYLGMKMLGQMVILYLTHWETIKHSHSHQQCKRVPIFPHLSQHYFPYFKKISAYPVSMKQYLIVILVCIFLKILWASVHMFVHYLYIFFAEMFIQELCPIFNYLFCWVVKVLCIIQ